MGSGNRQNLKSIVRWYHFINVSSSSLVFSFPVENSPYLSITSFDCSELIASSRQHIFYNRISSKSYICICYFLTSLIFIKANHHSNEAISAISWCYPMAFFLYSMTWKHIPLHYTLFSRTILSLNNWRKDAIQIFIASMFLAIFLAILKAPIIFRTCLTREPS